MPKVIECSNGFFTLVDDVDYEWASLFKWREHAGYAARSQDERVVFLHRLILNVPEGKVTDHINGVRWDNRRVNLRICTLAENGMNRVKGFNAKTSDYKGVHFRKDNQSRPWRASIRKDGKLRHLGNFMTQEDAARAYDQAAKTMFGPFSKLNFPDTPKA